MVRIVFQIRLGMAGANPVDTFAYNSEAPSFDVSVAELLRALRNYTRCNLVNIHADGQAGGEIVIRPVGRTNDESFTIGTWTADITYTPVIAPSDYRDAMAAAA
jgi:hypothetical protein